MRLLAVLALVPGLLAGDVPIPPDHYTKAELNAFTSGHTHAEAMLFLSRLAATSPYLSVKTYGATGQGRPMPVVIVSKEKAFTPEEAWKSGKPVVLVINSIHGGEVDGTEASMILLRDLALGNRPEILAGVTLLVVPFYNLDGYERVSRFNRPNQDGPRDGMGFRTTSRGLDLNRDFLKLDAEETRALVTLAGEWRPDLFVDDHVTDGIDFQPTLTVAYGPDPPLSAPLLAFLHRVVPKALSRVEEDGFLTAIYGDPTDGLDPAKGFDIGFYPPRYSTGYFPLRHVPSILVETHAIKPFERRVQANERFLRALLELTAKNAGALKEARDASRTEVRRAKVGTQVVLDAEVDRTRSTMRDFATYAFRTEVSPVSGKPVVRFDRTKPMTLKVPFHDRVKPTLTVPRPAGYLVPAGWPSVEERLRIHGIPFQKLETKRTLEVGTYRVDGRGPESPSYQGRARVKPVRIVKATETRELPAGSLYVPLDTELATLAMALLEPEAPDSLFSWGEMSTILEQKEYIDLRVLDPMAEKMLAADPKLRELWEEKLKDPAFAGDSRARSRFFYQRTPYWDDTVNLVPIYRLEKPM